MIFSHAQVYAWTADVLSALRYGLDSDGFDEILPAILSDRYEPGARHSVAVLGNRALPGIDLSDRDDEERVVVTGAAYYYLPVSHCVEKQLALEHAERVYCIAPCLRLLMEGEESSGRHLYTFYQAEVEWKTDDVEDAYSTVERVLKRFAGELVVRLQRRGTLSAGAAERIAAFTKTPYERIPFGDARRRVTGAGGKTNPHAAGDLTHAEEFALSMQASAPFWLTDYPDGVRDSLYRRTASGTFATYDLVLPSGNGELATGGLRPDSAHDIRRQARKFTSTPHGQYADWKERTNVQSGGIGFGVERLIRYCAGASSVLDLRFAHDQGPNARIGKGGLHAVRELALAVGS